MEELVVTRFWMAGVMAIMLLYGGIALAGVFFGSRRSEGSAGTQTEEE